ncbi:MAG: hypothetical protein ACXWBR_11760 [Usitatibacter sp.]
MIDHQAEIAYADTARADREEHDLVERARRVQHRAARDHHEAQHEQAENAAGSQSLEHAAGGAHGWSIRGGRASDKAAARARTRAKLTLPIFYA